MEKRICIGKIVAAHGIKGEVKVMPAGSDPSVWESLNPLENKDATRVFTVKVTGKASVNMRVKIKGVDTRNDAEALVGEELYAMREKLPPVEDDVYYLQDLEGLDVCLKTEENRIGKIKRVLNFGAGDILEVKLDGQKETELLPFTKQYVPEVNISGGYVVVSAPRMIFAEDDGDEDAES